MTTPYAGWRLVTDVDTRGAEVALRVVCPACWQRYPEPEGKTRFGRTDVAFLRRSLNHEETCYHCQRHPEAHELWTAERTDG